MTSYLVTWYIHVTSVTLSISFFAVRGIWMMMDSPLLQKKLVKILPHVIDTALLVSAIVLTMLIGQYPFIQSWLTVKVIALIVYIVLGIFALRANRLGIRIAAFLAAVSTFGFMVSVAYYHHPLGIFLWL